MSAREVRDWDAHSEWVVRSIESLECEMKEHGALLRKLDTDIRVVVRVSKALGWVLGLVGGAGAVELVKKFIALLASAGVAAAILYFG